MGHHFHSFDFLVLQSTLVQAIRSLNKIFVRGRLSMLLPTPFLPRSFRDQEEAREIKFTLLLVVSQPQEKAACTDEECNEANERKHTFRIVDTGTSS